MLKRSDTRSTRGYEVVGGGDKPGTSKVIPKSLNFSDPLPMAVPNKRTRLFATPSGNQSFIAGQQALINIGTSAEGSFMVPATSCLRFTVTSNVTATSGLPVPEGSAFSFIDTLILRSNDGSEIDRINSFGVLGQILLDYSVEADALSTIGSAALGCSSTDKRVVGSNSGTATGVIALQDKDNQCPTIPNGTSRTYCIPLLGLLGTLDKLLPLSRIQNGLMMEIIWAQNTSAMKLQPVSSDALVANNTVFTAPAGTVLTYTVSDVEFSTDIVTMDADFMARFDQALSLGGISSVYQSWTNFQFPVSGSSYNVQVNSNASSARSLIWTTRLESDISSIPAWGTAGRHFNAHTQYQVRNGEQYYPPKPCNLSATNTGEAMKNMYKALGFELGNLNGGNFGGSVDNESYVSAANVAAVSANGSNQGVPLQRGKFALGVSLDNFNNESIEAGLNLKVKPTLEIQAQMTAAGASRLDAYLLQDRAIFLGPDRILKVIY